MNISLKHKTIANISYNLLSRVFTYSLASATGIILARNLTASDYGIVGFAMIFIAFLRQFNDMGITASIIRKEILVENELYTAFTLKLIFALVIFLASFAWGSLSQWIFDNQAVRSVIIVIAAGFLVSCFGFLSTIILTRDLKFKRLIIPQVSSQVAATVVAIITVYMGLRYWSIVISELAAGVVTVVAVFILCPVTLKLRWDTKLAKEHLKFGSNLFFAELMMFLLFNSDNFIVGAVGGAAVLGFYAIAFNWSTKVQSLIGQATHTILLSTFSRVQQDTARLKAGYLAILEYVSFGAIFANTLLLIISKELLTLVLGAGTGKWLPALGALEILCVYGALRTVLEPVGCMVTAIGKPALMSKANCLSAGIQMIFLYPALRYLGIDGIALIVTLALAVEFLIYFPAIRRDINLSYTMVFRAVLPALLSGFALAAFGEVVDRLMSTSWSSLAFKLVFGSAIYLFTFGWATKWKILKEAKEIIGGVLLRPTRAGPSC